MINFKDKNVLITGANGFIGSSLSELFYNLGANLILTDKVKKPLKLKKLINKKKTHYLSCDLAMGTSILNFQKKILNN